MDRDDADAVSYGTPLATEEDDKDEAPRKKPVPIEQQEVRDERGLRRFHGAFTGGFSAGYFNTVGTKEGWAPATFSSSRAERAGKQSQRPEDFMDTEDLGVFGIAPRAIQVNKEFAEEQKGVKGARKRQMIFNEGPIPGLPPLKDLIVPSSESAGVKLLRRMGWKPGQGIGPRVKTKKKRKPKNIDITEEPETPGVKIYGCFLPKDVSLHEDSDDEELLRGITFAPDDVEVMSYKTKDDFHGIGYTGLDRNPILATFHSGKTAIAPPPVRDKKKKLAITGEAFGVGVYEEDDENIYCMDDMTQYDFELGAGAISKKADKNKVVKVDLKKGVRRVCEVLEGFHIASKPTARKKRYPPPDLPRNFQPIHQKAGTVSEPVKQEMTFMDRHRMTASERAEIVGTENPKSSVFDFLRPEDKDRLLSISNKNRPSTATDVASASPAPVSSAPPASVSSAPVASVSSAPIAAPKSFSVTGRKGTSGFQPFANDENKQKRYELYLKFKDEKKEDHVFEKFQSSKMNEWEKMREVEEFRLASAIYKPLAHGMALRFVTAKQADLNVEMKAAVAKAKTAGIVDEEKMVAEEVALDYGKGTRTMLAWHPDRLLCRRFNVPNPYPESTLVGTMKFKRDRFSVFNLFGVAGAKTTVGEDLLAIELPKEPEPPATSSRNDSVATPPTAPKVERINLSTDLGEIDKKPIWSTNVSALSKQEDVIDDKSEKDEMEMTRPPLDLFKAIFQNTDSEGGSSSSSSEDEANKDTDGAKQETIAPVKAISLADEIRNHSVAMRNYAPAITRPKSSRFSDFDTLDEPPVGFSTATDNAQKRLASVAVIKPSSASDSNYGPALPPHLQRQSSADVADDRDRKHRDKKSSHKSKHKHKHKKRSKSKHGKHKREKDRNNSDSSSDSEATETDLNRLIKTRLKKHKSTDVM